MLIMKAILIPTRFSSIVEKLYSTKEQFTRETPYWGIHERIFEQKFHSNHSLDQQTKIQNKKYNMAKHRQNSSAVYTCYSPWLYVFSFCFTWTYDLSKEKLEHQIWQQYKTHVKFTCSLSSTSRALIMPFQTI